MSLQSMRRWEPHFPVIKRVAAMIQSIILDNNSNVSHWSVYNGLSDPGSHSGWEDFSFRRMTAVDGTRSLSMAKGRPSSRWSQWLVAPCSRAPPESAGLLWGWGCEKCLLVIQSFCWHTAEGHPASQTLAMQSAPARQPASLPLLIWWPLYHRGCSLGHSIYTTAGLTRFLQMQPSCFSF